MKSDLIKRLVELNPELEELESRKLIESFFSAMTEHLAGGGDIQLRGFGRFFVSRLEPQAVHNLVTGESAATKARRAVRFRSYKPLGALLNATELWKPPRRRVSPP